MNLMWSVSAEILAFILIIMIGLFSYEKGKVRSTRKKIFDIALCLAELSVVLNIACVYTVENYQKIPYRLNMFLNSGYFLVSIGMCTAIAVYFFDLILEHVYSKSCRKRAVIGVSVIVTIYLVLWVSNFWTGHFFWFDAQGIYHRGALNQSGYMLMLAELVLVLICYFKNRASVEKGVKRVIYTMPPVVLLLVAFQMAFPTILMNGTIAAFAMIIIFGNFQNSQAERDSLTRIGNRKSFYEELCLRLKGNQQIQVVLVSLNDFAAVNQQFGYRKGDEFLYHIAQWLENFQPEGRAFRFSNVTFALLCPYTEDIKARNLLNQIAERFRQLWELGEVEYRISASFGSMICRKNHREVTEIVEMLSFMMETARIKGMETVEFDAEIEHMFQQKKNLLLLMKDSIKKRRFQVWYQPIFDCRQQKFVSAEALLRLKDYKGNMVSPAEFIPLAEENGMIEEIGWFVWEGVCRFFENHPDIPLESISINMSMSQFRNPKLYKIIDECLERHHVPPNKIKMEITERVVLNDMKYMKQLMKSFTSKGLRFCMDDFGTGYSNFANIMYLPFELIKLDRSLIEEITSSQRNRQAVQSMMGMFHAMDLKIVSEGIETEEQQKVLRDMGTDYIQGFYYAKPMPEAAFERLLNG